MKIILLLSFFFRSSLGDDNACINSNKLPCLALLNLNRLPKNDKCDPIKSKNCDMSDLIDEKVSSCQLSMVDQITDKKDHIQRSKRLNKEARCYPTIREYINVFRTRIVDQSTGNPTCVSNTAKPFVCGTKGSRCICDTGLPDPADPDYFLNHKCRCQWFADYCSVSDICTGKDSKCSTIDQVLSCGGGSISHCIVNPTLCAADEKCVELEDKGMEWKRGEERVGEGFSCINKNTADDLPETPFCNFQREFKNMKLKPLNGVDKCCYHHLLCATQQNSIGYLFGNKPCYCNVDFRHCLSKQTSHTNKKLRGIAKALVKIVDEIKICTMDDSGKCDPRKSESCSKGDLIDPSIAHCKVNCATGPLLPIELRSCRIRQCHPKNSKGRRGRIVDVTLHQESSRCDAVKDTPVQCGFEHTRCVCDGQPTTPFFTDRCRCQYWPMN